MQSSLGALLTGLEDPVLPAAIAAYTTGIPMEYRENDSEFRAVAILEEEIHRV